MDTCKLTYFNAKALGEPIRFLLHYLDQPFEDIRCDWNEWQAGARVNAPFGKLPVLNIDGKTLHQSMAICRYLARKAGLYGDDGSEAVNIDMMAETFQDFRYAAYDLFKAESPEKKKELKAKILEETVPFYLKKFDDIIKLNKGYLANGKLSWADLYFVGYFPAFKAIIGEDILAKEKYPNVAKMINNVESVPSIKAWIEKRPESEY